MVYVTEPISVMTRSSIRYHLLVETENAVHRLEECELYNEQYSPLEGSPTDRHFLMILNLKGSSVWRHQSRELVIDSHQVVVLPACSGLTVRKQGNPPCHLLLWYFDMEKMLTVNKALGSDFQLHCTGTEWPLWGPHPLNSIQESLILALRNTPQTPLLTLWYSAKFLELISSLPPPTPQKNSTANALHPAVRQCLNILHAEYTRPPSLEEIATKSGVSPTHLSHLFAREVGTTISRYIQRLRMQQASLLLRSGECNVTEAAFSVGYSSLGQFSQTFRETYGHPPGKHRQMTNTTTA